MVPNSTSTRPAPAAGSDTYLELENHLSFKSGERAITMTTVLYCRKAEPDQPQGLLDRIMAPLKSAIAAVRTWRAKNWVVNYVQTHFNASATANQFLQSVREQGRVKREDFLCLLLSDKVNAWSGDREQRPGVNAGATLNPEKRDAVIEKFIKQELSKASFSPESVDALIDYLKLGRISEPHEAALWEFLNTFAEKYDADRANQILSALKPKADQLGAALEMLNKQRSIQLRASTASNLAATQVKPDKASGAEARSSLARQLEQIWSQEGDVGMAGLKLVKDRRNAFVQYLRAGLSGMDDDHIYHLHWFAKSARTQEVYQCPAGLMDGDSSALGQEFERALVEILRIDPTLPKKSDTELLKSALTRIIVSSALGRAALEWSVASQALLSFSKDGKLPDNPAELERLRKLIDPQSGANFTKIRDVVNLDPAEANRLHELIRNLYLAFKKTIKQSENTSG
jgi:hypothetical protein